MVMLRSPNKTKAGGAVMIIVYHILSKDRKAWTIAIHELEVVEIHT
jgi:hypothetical protein